MGISPAHPQPERIGAVRRVTQEHNLLVYCADVIATPNSDEATWPPSRSDRKEKPAAPSGAQPCARRKGAPVPADHQARPAAAANDRFRRTVGREAGTRGRIMFDSALEDLPTRLRARIIDAVRAYEFRHGADADHDPRASGTFTLEGVAFRFSIEVDPEAPEPEQRVLRIGLA
jgi:hypothetical protein